MFSTKPGGKTLQEQKDQGSLPCGGMDLKPVPQRDKGGLQTQAGGVQGCRELGRMRPKEVTGVTAVRSGNAARNSTAICEACAIGVPPVLREGGRAAAASCV